MTEVIRSSVHAGTDPLSPDHPQAGQPAVRDTSRLSHYLSGQRIAMLATVLPDGNVETKPMTLLELDERGALWFFCQHLEGDEATRARYQRLNLSFSDEVRSVFVSIIGRGELLRDRARIEALWTPAARGLFPDGPTSGDLALLKVTPERTEYWETVDGLLSEGMPLSVGG